MTRPATAKTPRRPLSRRKRAVFTLAVVLFLTTGQEFLFRAFFRVPEVAGFNRVRYQMMAGTAPTFQAAKKRGLVYDRLLFESQPDGFSEVHGLNLYGFRTRDFSIAPPSSGHRILMLGDSLTEGQGAPDSGTIAVAWEKLLARDGVESEVLNLGVVAATLDHLTLLARDAVPLLRPTDVVLVLYANDLPVGPFPSQLSEPGPRFPRRETAWYTPRLFELIGRLIQDEPIYRRWPHAPLRFFPVAPNPTNPWTGKPGSPPDLDPRLYRAMAEGRMNPWLYEQSKAIPGMLSHDFDLGGKPTPYLRRIAEICRTAKANLLVVYIPFYAVTSPRYVPFLTQLGMDAEVASSLAKAPEYRRQNRALEAVCAGLDLPLVDTTEPLSRAEAAGVPQFWGYDSHPRPVGYATIAVAIHKAWVRSFNGR